jgi:pimeloyl-ACP methyl ester carboxylesterase
MTKPAVVLLHSSMSSQAQWARLVTRAGSQYRFYAVDLLGYGRSPFPPETDGFHLGHEVDAVLASLAGPLDSGEPFHLVGHSYGGATALRMARMLGPRVRSLCVFEPVAFNLLRGIEPAAYHEIASVVDAIGEAADAAGATRAFIDYWNRPGTFDSLPTPQRERFAGQIEKVKLDFTALLSDPATPADLARLDLPALVLSGRSSPLSTRRIADVLARHLPRADAHVVEGGHMAPITHADAVNDAICAFLDRVSERATALG